jgi:hypothetical protein
LENWTIFGGCNTNKKTREKAPFKVCVDDPSVCVASKRKTTTSKNRDDNVGRRFGAAGGHRERVSSIQKAQQRCGGVAVAVA